MIATGLGAASAAAAAPVDATRAADESTARDYLYDLGPRPSAAAVARAVDRARRHDADPDALFWAAQWWANGWVKREAAGDFDAIAALRRAADAGHARAMALYGMTLCAGKAGGPADVPKGMDLLRRAARAGEPTGFHFLATVYAAGAPGVERDLATAQGMAKDAVDKGMARSLGLLAKVYGQRGDAERATEYAERAAKAGDPEMIQSVIRHYLLGPQPDPAKAVAWMRRGALMGEPARMFDYAVSLEDEVGGLKRDPALSRHLLRRAAAEGDRGATAMLALGRVTGAYGVPVDVADGVAALRRLVDDDVADAQWALGVLLVEGRHVPADRAGGAALIRKAAAQGHELANQWRE
ncbi:MAG TPA: hypothetical protein VEA69_24725 [Tepidisphaeraceae bacterium]|nr:hypothetical protein [Tepidisphaeraceae bacterium]